jgi:homoserine O-acetyltransferase
VLVPSWYTGTHDDSELFMLGEGRALDPNPYFIILTNLLANGLSSSPSNSPPPVERGRFPKVTIHDNVRLQHMLITEKLGIERLRLVTGFSMGACQTFQWAAQFPDVARAACPIAGSARTGNFNKVFLLALRRALELDPAYADGFYERPPVNGLKAFAAIYAGWGTSEPFFREEAFRPLGSRSMAEHVADFWEPFFLKCDADNLLSQLWTWEPATSARIRPMAATSGPRSAPSRPVRSSCRSTTTAISRRSTARTRRGRSRGPRSRSSRPSGATWR